VLQAAHGRDNRNTILAEANLARARALLGERNAARPMLEDAQRRLAAELGPDHPDVASIGKVLVELYGE
jgi:hypothetical protein